MDRRSGVRADNNTTLRRRNGAVTRSGAVTRRGNVTVTVKDRAEHSGGRDNVRKTGYVSVHLYDENLFHIPTRSVSICAKQILGSRKKQQDAYAVSQNTTSLATEKARAWAIVCDGMGGMESGELASKTTVDIVSQVLGASKPSDPVPSVLLQAIAISNDAVKSISEEAGGASGTTLVCTVIEGDKLHYASVGDSRIYICRDNEFIQITRDHNYMLELTGMVERGEITAEEALCDPQKDALISFVGIDDLKLVDINNSALELKDGDILLLCSDGLTKVMSDNEIYYYIKNSGDIEGIVDTLLAEVQNRKLTGLDNTTIAVMKYAQN